MATVAELKTKARELERQGHIDKALAIYRHLLKHLEGRPALEAELPLFVKVGDLERKQGRADEAVAMYERAANRYVARGLGKSVVALSVKILRVDATRTSVYRRFARGLLDGGHVEAAREVLLDYAQRAKRDAAVAVLERVADQPEEAVRAALERMLAPAGPTASGPRPALEAVPLRASGPRGAVNDDEVTASRPRPAVEIETAVSGPRPSVGPSGPRPAISATHASEPRPRLDTILGSGPRRAVGEDAAPAAPVVSGSRPAVRFSPSREAEALDQDTGPASIPVEPPTFRGPFGSRSVPDESVGQEPDDERAPPAPRVAPPERRRAFAGTASPAGRGRTRRGWRWIAAALVLLAVGAVALAVFGVVPLDVRALGANVGLGRDAQREGADGRGGSEPQPAVPVAVTDSSTADTAAIPVTVGDSTSAGSLSVPGAPPPPARSADTAPGPEVAPALGAPPPSILPATPPADTTAIGARAARPAAVDSGAAPAGATTTDAPPIRLPAGVSASGSVVVVPGLAIASLDESPTGHEVVHRLDGGELLVLSAIRFGGAADTSTPSPVRVTTLPGDTAVGTARIGEFMVSARASMPADALQALLRRLVVVEPTAR